MSIEDINYMKENSIKQSYTFIVDSFDRDRNMYPNPNNYVINFSTPFKNIIGMEIIDASIPRAMYTIDVDNNEIYYYIGNDTDDVIIENGVQIYNNSDLLLKNWNYTSNIFNTSNISNNFNVSNTSNISNKSTIVNTSNIFNTSVIIDLSINSNIFNMSNILNTSNIFNTTTILNSSNIFNNQTIINKTTIFNNSNIFNSSNISTLKILNTSNILSGTPKQINTSNNIVTTSNISYIYNNIFNSSNIFNIFNTINTSNIFSTSNILNTTNIYNTSNINNISLSSNISHLEISGDRYAILNNSINLYNIYNNTNNIGGTKVGITFNMCFRPLISDYNNKYNIIDFSYDHIYIDDIGTDIIFKNISIDIEKDTDDKFILTFTIGSKIEVLSININNYINIYWSILNTSWYIGIFDINKSLIIYKENSNCEKIYNVFYTKKYIGKKHQSQSIWGTNILQLKDFKIYNVPMTTYDNMLSAINETLLSTISLPVWFKMNEIINKTNIINSGYNSTIYYEDIFKKIYIKPGDYTFKTFISKFNDLLIPDEIEIMFKETSTPPELTNLIDIYSKMPLLVDMKRSTITENLGFDLYPTQNNEDKYISKPYTNADSVLAKMFYSRLNTSHDTETRINKYIITSPGIVYFIGNKYIIMRCPEIEEHLYRSLSYSKYTLGLAKFRVDSVGINSEKLTITKLPVREFHPIGKLSRMTLRFETKNGTLYDFKGINHNIIFAIFYYEPIQKNIPTSSILNPEYKMNYIDYLYKQEEIEGDSDDEEEDNDEI